MGSWVMGNVSWGIGHGHGSWGTGVGVGAIGHGVGFICHGL